LCSLEERNSSTYTSKYLVNSSGTTLVNITDSSSGSRIFTHFSHFTTSENMPKNLVQIKDNVHRKKTT